MAKSFSERRAAKAGEAPKLGRVSSRRGSFRQTPVWVPGDPEAVRPVVPGETYPVFVAGVLLAFVALFVCYQHNYLLLYGDAVAHLAIARRVLTREVDGDRMHLAETVKAALARVQEDGGSVLHVPMTEVGSWREMFGGQVEVVGEASLNEGECELETKVGRVEMGVRVQMEEIERGFGELMPRQERA